MISTTIPAIYQNGIFQPLEQPTHLIDQQRVQLYVIVPDNTLSPPLPSLEEDDDFVDKMMGIWRVEDQELRRWVAEEVSLYDDGVSNGTPVAIHKRRHTPSTKDAIRNTVIFPNNK